MKCNYFIACQTGIIDFQSKKATAVNILEDFHSPSFPIAIAASVITSINKEDSDSFNSEIFVEVVLGDIHLIKDHKISLTFNPISRGIKSMTTFAGLIISNPGKLKFRLYDKVGKTYGDFFIDIEQQSGILPTDMTFPQS